MPWTWFVRPNSGDVTLDLFVGDRKRAWAGVARLQLGAGSWIDIVLDVEQTTGVRTADLPYVTGAARRAVFSFGVRAISASSRTSAPVYIAVRQAGSIVPAELDSQTNNGEGTTAAPYRPVHLLDAPEATSDNDFALDSFGLVVI